MVPVLRNAEKLAIVEAAEGVARLAAGCRIRRFSEELTGSSFTISMLARTAVDSPRQ